VSDATIRLATPDDAQAIAHVRVTAWRTTYRGLIPDAYLDAMKVEDSATLWGRVLAAPPNKTNTFVAEIDGAVVGFASGLMLADKRHEFFDAELTGIYLVPEAQRAGIGARLVATVAAAQRAHGATAMIVWVIAGNKGARVFYEQLGAEFVLEQPFTWDGMDLVEAGYGWRDLPALIEAGGAAAVLH
jgi:GNAT superfamily N-acetyltransferase